MVHSDHGKLRQVPATWDPARTEQARALSTSYDMLSAWPSTVLPLGARARAREPASDDNTIGASRVSAPTASCYVSLAVNVDQESPGTDRYRILRRIGAGGLGVVYEAHDLVRNEQVALKTLRAYDSHGLYLLKREFRALADIAHPNLIHLYDLVVEPERRFFTMELIQGVDFLQWCSNQPDGLRDALGQLSGGLQALHGAGKIHRDIKANNVLVTKQGRVVLLDFGLAGDLRRGASDSLAGRMVGTAAYMSPEQSRAEPVLTPASDWYSVGVLLYLALTGQLPFEGTTNEVIRAKLTQTPKPPQELAPQAPDDLSALCVQLLATDAASRADGDAILGTLGTPARATPTAARPHTPSSPPPLFLGRTSELRALCSARESAPAVVAIEGPSGIGKTALVREFLRQQRLRGELLLVLEGRCYEREQIPYKALDGLVDQLSHYWRQLDDRDAAQLVPRDAALLARLFPVLARVPVVAASSHAPGPQEPVQLRRKAFAALRDTFRRVAEQRSTVLFLDDLQWADRDTATLLAELFRGADAPPLLLVMCISSAPSHAPIAELLQTLTPMTTRLRLSPLAHSEATAIAGALLGSNDHRATHIAAEAAGNPLFVTELARHATTSAGPEHTTIDTMVANQLSELTTDARTLLEIVACMGEPIDPSLAATAAGIEPAISSRELRTLRTRRLVRRTSGDIDESYVSYHRRIREAVLRAMPPEQQTLRHRALAEVLETCTPRNTELLAQHWLAAGELQRGATHSHTAAVEADNSFAFDRAARLYSICIKLLPDDAPEQLELLEAHANALANAGRGPEAAESFRQAAHLTTGHRSRELRRRAAEQLLKSGHIDDGLELLGTVLAPLGIRLSRTPVRALAQLASLRLRLRLRGLHYTERSIPDLDPRELARIDVCHSVSQGLSFVDNVVAAEFQARHLLLALRAGIPRKVARGLAAEAVFRASVSPQGRAAGEPLLARAAEIARGCNDPATLGIVWMCHGMAGVFCGEWERAISDCTRAESLFRDQCTDIQWELDTTRLFMLLAMFFRGQLAAMRQRVADHLHEANDRGDHYMTAALQTLSNQYLLLADDTADESEHVATEAMSGWSQRGFYSQHMYQMFADIHRAIYRGDGAGAWQQVKQSWGELRRSQLLRVQLARVNAYGFRGRAAVAAGRLDEAERAAGKLEREHRMWARSFAAVLRAGIAIRRNDTTANALLERAEQVSAEADMQLQVWFLRWIRGQRVGGAEGESLSSHAELSFRAQGIQNPTRYARIIAPGCVAD